MNKKRTAASQYVGLGIDLAELPDGSGIDAVPVGHVPEPVLAMVPAKTQPGPELPTVRCRNCGRLNLTEDQAEAGRQQLRRRRFTVPQINCLTPRCATCTTSMLIRIRDARRDQLRKKQRSIDLSGHYDPASFL